jgi:hypothetical protein
MTSKHNINQSNQSSNKDAIQTKPQERHKSSNDRAINQQTQK